MISFVQHRMWSHNPFFVWCSRDSRAVHSRNRQALWAAAPWQRGLHYANQGPFCECGLDGTGCVATQPFGIALIPQGLASTTLLCAVPSQRS